MISAANSRLSGALLLSLFLLACNKNSEKPSTVIVPSLENHNWQLVSITQGGSVQEISDSLEITANFFRGSTTSVLNIAGKGGCNDYAATATVEGNQLMVRSPRATKKLCGLPQNVMQTELRYLLALGKATRFGFDDGNLQIFYGSSRDILTFRDSAQSD